MFPTKPYKRGLAALIGFLVGSAWSGAEPLPLCSMNNPNPVPAQETIRVTFLGVQGFLIERDDDVVLTPPFFSNPGLARVFGVYGSLVHDPRRIDEVLSANYGSLEDRWQDVDAIVVGHSHYDHLMDLPYLLEKWDLQPPRIFASLTAATILRTFDIGPSAVTVVNDIAGTHEAPGTWSQVPGASVRVMALCSEHSSQFMGFHTWQGRLGHRTEDGEVQLPSRRPRTAPEWTEGLTYAYLIDFRDRDETAFRIYYADSPTAPPYGFLPPGLRNTVDLILLTGGGAGDTPGYPIPILEDTGARFAILGHWEGFFRSQLEPLERLPGVNDVLANLAKAPDGPEHWHCLPPPGAVFELPIR